MTSGWGDDFQVFLQRVRLMRQASLPHQVAPSGDTPAADETMCVDEEAEDVAQIVQQQQQEQPQATPVQNDDATTTAKEEAAASSAVVAPSVVGGMVKVTVGIDEDLRLILEMDPSIVDLGGQWAQPSTRVLGLPPISGG